MDSFPGFKKDIITSVANLAMFKQSFHPNQDTGSTMSNLLTLTGLDRPHSINISIYVKNCRNELTVWIILSAVIQLKSYV